MWSHSRCFWSPSPGVWAPHTSPWYTSSLNGSWNIGAEFSEFRSVVCRRCRFLTACEVEEESVAGDEFLRDTRPSPLPPALNLLTRLLRGGCQWWRAKRLELLGCRELVSSKSVWWKPTCRWRDSPSQLRRAWRRALLPCRPPSEPDSVSSNLACLQMVKLCRPYKC